MVLGILMDQSLGKPPCTWYVLPLTKLPSAEQTVATTLPISSGMPIDSLGTLSLFQSGPENSVLMSPGAIPLTPMPSDLSSSFIQMIMFSKAAFVDP